MCKLWQQANVRMPFEAWWWVTCSRASLTISSSSRDSNINKVFQSPPASSCTWASSAFSSSSRTPTSTRSSSRHWLLPAPNHRRPSPAPQELRHLQGLPVAADFFLRLCKACCPPNPNNYKIYGCFFFCSIGIYGFKNSSTNKISRICFDRTFILSILALLEN